MVRRVERNRRRGYALWLMATETARGAGRERGLFRLSRARRRDGRERRDGGLVYLVCLVSFVHRTKETRETKQTRATRTNHSACVRRHAEFHPGYLWEGVHNPKQFSVLGLPCGASMRCRLLLGLLSVLAHSSNPTVALTRSRFSASERSNFSLSCGRAIHGVHDFMTEFC